MLPGPRMMVGTPRSANGLRRWRTAPRDLRLTKDLAAGGDGALHDLGIFAGTQGAQGDVGFLEDGVDSLHLRDRLGELRRHLLRGLPRYGAHVDLDAAAVRHEVDLACPPR